MQLLDIVILAIVQGITEFLPVSSSGHLVLLERLLGHAPPSATVEIILHAGTLGSILIVYWQRIWRMLTSDRRVIGLLVIGTLPVVVVGLPIKLFAEGVLKDPVLAGVMLLVTASLLVMLRLVRVGEDQYTSLVWWQALVIGCFQAVAVLPGISRSGSTIFGGRLLGLRGVDAVAFSFLLAIPALSGATLLELISLYRKGGGDEDVALLFTGAVIALVIGVFALRWLISWSRKGRLHWFALWCAPLGLTVIGLYLAGYLHR